MPGVGGQCLSCCSVVAACGVLPSSHFLVTGRPKGFCQRPSPSRQDCGSSGDSPEMQFSGPSSGPQKYPCGNGKSSDSGGAPSTTVAGSQPAGRRQPSLMTASHSPSYTQP